MKALKIAGFGLLAVCQSLPQSATTALSFDAASVRAYHEGDGAAIGTSGGPETRDPGRYVGRGMPLRLYLCVAFNIRDCQEQISGPRWIDDKYDIVANVPPGSTKEQFRTMLQNLLGTRFHLMLHQEMKTLPVYELMVAKGGPKLKRSVEEARDAPQGVVTGKVEHDADGFPIVPPGRPALIRSFGPGWVSHWRARQQPMSRLAEALGQPNASGRQVIDKTGLSGEYDFTLSYQMRPPGANPGDDAPGLILEDALEQQLGLKLVNGKAPFDFVVIESGERAPVDN
ncbi:MAG TPA: TIGR03435 family protein [Bryobacteraceae bacterium]|jgi:uncharacterized protein (TIGR03435 family)